MKKGIFTSLIFIGIFSAILMVLSPVHEFFHWLAAFMQGVPATMSWTVTYIDTDKVGLFIGYAGMFGETITFLFLFFKLVQKKHFMLATYIFGYSLSYLILIPLVLFAGYVPIDLEVMLANCNNLAVYGVFYLWIAIYAITILMQILTIIEFRDKFFKGTISYLARKTREKIAYLDKKEEQNSNNGENRYKPLTLV